MEFTHFDEKGNAIMVDVTDKNITERQAVASGRIRVNQEVFERIENGSVAKGDVLGTARIAGIMAAKRTFEQIPLCHMLQLTKCSIDFVKHPSTLEIEAVCLVKTTGKTGVEMEALTGVQTALLTIYDMCKAIDKAMVMGNIRLLEKTGGKSGVYRAETDISVSEAANSSEQPAISAEGYPARSDSQPAGKHFEHIGTVKAVCTSPARGTEKKNILSARFIADYGIEGDAHAGNWHRQVSLLSYERIAAFNSRGAAVTDGAFGENLVVEGFDFSALPVGTVFRCNDVVLEITQIGKECHQHCQIYYRMGECIMPTQGVFARVVHGGTISVGDRMEMFPPSKDRPLTAAVLTLSDKGYAGERQDESGPAAAGLLRQAGYLVLEQLVLPDEQPLIEKELIRLADSRQIDLIVTTGGTGFSLRDRTPEAALAVSDRNAPGIAEAIRAGSMQITERAMLSRGVSVLRKHSLIVTLPGSPKAVRESLGFILPELAHGLRVLTGSASECAAQAAK